MSAKWKISAALLIWGSMGLLVKGIDMPSSAIALLRSLIGLLFLMLLGKFLKMPVNRPGLKRNWKILMLSGAALGTNWIFLFEAYKRTSVANATLSYYTAPIMLAILSWMFLRERLSGIRIICMLVAVLGLATISGVFEPSQASEGNGLGILCGMAAAFMYASLTLLNKSIHGLGSMDATIAQFSVGALVLLPYAILTVDFPTIDFGGRSVLLLLVLGVVHTGLAFWLYFSAVKDLKAQTIAVFSYLDPVSAIILSAMFLSEPLGPVKLLGAGLILGSTFISESVEQRAGRLSYD